MALNNPEEFIEKIEENWGRFSLTEKFILSHQLPPALAGGEKESKSPGFSQTKPSK